MDAAQRRPAARSFSVAAAPLPCHDVSNAYLSFFSAVFEFFSPSVSSSLTVRFFFVPFCCLDKFHVAAPKVSRFVSFLRRMIMKCSFFKSNRWGSDYITPWCWFVEKNSYIKKNTCKMNKKRLATVEGGEQDVRREIKKYWDVEQYFLALYLSPCSLVFVSVSLERMFLPLIPPAFRSKYSAYCGHHSALAAVSKTSVVHWNGANKLADYFPSSLFFPRDKTSSDLNEWGEGGYVNIVVEDGATSLRATWRWPWRWAWLGD